MCGITGFNWDDKNLLRKMTTLLAHRGPDDCGYYSDKEISFGHRRLSIVDLSKRGAQPMYNENKTIIVVFNGEIYNFKELRSSLEIKGHKFASNSDTEVIVHGYEEHGQAICRLLKGMFAFALWDNKKKLLLIARDHIGEKPLYYYWGNKKFIFASEIKSILEYQNIERKIDMQNFSDYLTLRFSSDGKTMFRGIRKLEPGQLLILHKDTLNIKNYWKMPDFSGESLAEPSIMDKIIDKAVKERLMADVPVGVFLSGGLDSSSIVAYLSQYTERLQTFSVGFQDSTDETKYAEIISQRFQTEHHEVISDKDASLSYLPSSVWHLDEPMADPAVLPTYMLSQAVSKKIKVALSGEGGDEAFGGYDSPNLLNILKKIHKIPSIVRKRVMSPLSHLTSNLFYYPKKQKLQLISDILKSDSIKENYKKLFYLPFNANDKKEILSSKIQGKIALKTSFDEHLSDERFLLEGTYKYYFREWLPNDLLMKTDKIGMAHSLEIRAPFLDKDLVEYSCGLSWKYKYKRALFRKVVRKKLPKEILSRKKQGFTLPLSNWFSKKDFVARSAEHFKDLGKRGFFVLSKYQNIIKNPGKFRNDHRMWVLLNLELWCKIYMDNINYKKIQI